MRTDLTKNWLTILLKISPGDRRSQTERACLLVNRINLKRQRHFRGNFYKKNADQINTVGVCKSTVVLALSRYRRDGLQRLFQTKLLRNTIYVINICCIYVKTRRKQVQSLYK